MINYTDIASEYIFDNNPQISDIRDEFELQIKLACQRITDLSPKEYNENNNPTSIYCKQQEARSLFDKKLIIKKQSLPVQKRIINYMNQDIVEISINYIENKAIIGTKWLLSNEL